MAKQWHEFRNVTNETAELAIYDEISAWYGTGARDFHESMKAVDGKELTVALNTPGGSVFEGIAIYNMLRNRNGVTKTRVDGIAASIGSVILMAADPGQIHMPINSAVFTHLPLTWGEGNEEDFEKTIAELKTIKQLILNSYMMHAKVDRSEIEEDMHNERLYTAEECAEIFGAVVQPVTNIQNKFSGDQLPKSALNVYKNNRKFEDFTSGEVKPKEPKKKDTKMSKELEAQVATLMAQNTKLAEDHKTELTTKVDAARNENKTEEQERAKAIVALRDKYNNDKGDLNELTIAALSGDTSASDFKDQVLDHIVNKRTNTTSAAKPGEGEHEETDEVDENSIEGLQKKLAETTDSMERGRIATKIRNLRDA